MYDEDDDYSFDDDGSSSYGDEMSSPPDDDLSGDAADEFLKRFAGDDESEEESDEDVPSDGFEQVTPQSSSAGAAEEGLDLAALLGGLLSEGAPPKEPVIDATDPFAVGDGPTEGQLAWRESYFILFDKDSRPTLTQVEATIGEACSRLKIENLQADEDGYFRSVMVQAPEDNAALEISFESGDAVSEQSTELAKSLQKTLEGDQLARLLRSDARLDIMHFERLGASEPVAGGDSDEGDWDEAGMMAEGLDPASLITVVEALATLTDGLPIDPAAGELLI